MAVGQKRAGYRDHEALIHFSVTGCSRRRFLWEWAGGVVTVEWKRVPGYPALATGRQPGLFGCGLGPESSLLLTGRFFNEFY